MSARERAVEALRAMHPFVPNPFELIAAIEAAGLRIVDDAEIDELVTTRLAQALVSDLREMHPDIGTHAGGTS